MSQVIKLVSNLLTRKQYLNGIKCLRQYSSISKELIKQNQNAVSPDLLLQTLKSAVSTKNILELVNTHSSIMNSKHLIQALRSLFTLQKYGNSDLSTQQVLKHPDFEKLCTSLRFQAGLIELNDTIEALKVVCYVGVRSDSTISQVLLQLLRHQINQFSIHQIIFLDFLLAQLKSTPLIDALQIALPIVFEVQLKTKIDHDNLIHLTECLQYASKKDVSDKCIEFIVNNIMNYQGEIDAKSATSIIWSICDLEPNNFFQPLITRTIESLNIHLDDLTYRDMETTLTKLTNSFSHKYPFYYNEVFFDVCVNYVIDNDVGFEHGIYVVRKFNKVYHASNKLLDYLTTKLHEDPNLLEIANSSVPYILAASIALTNYRPIYWDEVKVMLQNTDKFRETDRKHIPILKLASALCILDIYKPEIIEKVFREDQLSRTIKRGYWSDMEYLVQIIQAIHLYKPEYVNMLPAKQTLKGLLGKMKHVPNYPLEGALEKALGGASYVKTRVTTELLHQIDHVIVLRKGGFPVAFATADSSNMLEHIEISQDHQIVLILGLNSFSYTMNRKLKGSSIFTIKSLEEKGYCVIPVCLEEWQNLLDFEKLPYLMQAIKLKTETGEKLTNSMY